MEDNLALLTSSGNWWGSFLIISTLVVLLGVAAEALQFIKCISPRVKYSIEIFAFWILIVGIAGELLGEAKTISIGDQISGFLNIKAGQANDRAGAAEKEAAESNVRAKALEKETEELKAKNLALAAEIAPRRLAPDKQMALARSLSSFSGRTIRTESYMLDSEAAILGRQIDSAFQLAHIRIDDALMTRLAIGSIALGVHVTGKDSDLVKALIDSLEAVGIRSTPQEPIPQGAPSIGSAPPATADATVFVGVKPINP